VKTAKMFSRSSFSMLTQEAHGISDTLQILFNVLTLQNFPVVRV